MRITKPHLRVKKARRRNLSLSASAGGVRFLVLTALFFVFGSPAQALDVREMKWGFDGKVVPGRFNMLSVLVDHSGPSAFDGELALYETRGLETSVGAPLVQPLYLAPGTQRWVQFAPFVTHDHKWQLRWGRGENNQITVEPAAHGAPATVLLYDQGSPLALRSVLQTHPEDLFPTTATAMASPTSSSH